MYETLKHLNMSNSTLKIYVMIMCYYMLLYIIYYYIIYYDSTFNVALVYKCDMFIIWITPKINFL